MKCNIFFPIIIVFTTLFSFYPSNENILSHKVNLNQQELKFYWKNRKGDVYGNFNSLKTSLHQKKQQLVFAMNGGMYKKDQFPQGLYIENGTTLSELDTMQKGYGNFYLQPNGIFFITKNNKAGICVSEKFITKKDVKYATQSGPMLLINGKIHPKFNKGSKNLNIRNGVGILPNNEVIFAMSKEKINFYDFATYFKTQGCKNALYLDGFISKMYLPEKNWIDKGGNFGVIIAETEKQ